MEGGPLINVGELSKPATVLVEKISDAIGGIFRPRQIRRIAEAEADADKIRALAEIEISALQRRALERFVAEEARKQDNIESITARALPKVNSESDPSDVEDDWITNFFDKARLVSDEEMQDLWSAILAGEANRPGKFSKRTVNYMASLDKEDALLFQRLMGFSWTFGGPTPMIYSTEDEIYVKQGITFTSATHLDEIGLISFNSISTYQKIHLPKRFAIKYFGELVVLEGPEEENSLDFGHVMLSRVGKDLAAVVEAAPVDNFVDYCLEKWQKKKFVTSSAVHNGS